MSLLKTQFIWLGIRQQLARLDMAALSAAFPSSYIFLCRAGPGRHLGRGAI